MNSNLMPSVEEGRALDYEISLMKKVIDYNHKRYLAFKHHVDFEKNIDFERILNARIQKVGRIKKRLLYLFTRFNYIYFCTFTFDDHYINKSDRTKRDLIKSVLNTHDFKYILNIDYGKTTEREHYHCILATNINFDVNQFIQTHYPCFSLSIQCKNGLNDFKKLSKYINKLTNHCIKSTTKRQRLVYNFKGYDSFCPTYKDVSLTYFLEYTNLFENVTLLDKGDITGKM